LNAGADVCRLRLSSSDLVILSGPVACRLFIGASALLLSLVGILVDVDGPIKGAADCLKNAAILGCLRVGGGGGFKTWNNSVIFG
jgi:hypothetical protein